MIKRRIILSALGGMAAIWPHVTRAQQKAMPVIGILASLSPETPHWVAFFDGLSRLGFVGGQNLQFDWQGFRLRPDQFPQHAAELVKSKVDVIIPAANAVGAVQQATTTIPILAISDDIVGEGFARSLAHPGGNITGISILAAELDSKRQELLIELLPGVRRIAVLADSRTAVPKKLQALQDAARAAGVELLVCKVGTPEEIAPAIDAAKALDAAALNVLASNLFFTNQRIIFERTAALGLPAMYQWPEMAHDGGLASYGPSFVQIYRQQLARQLTEILRGKQPANMPIEQPTNFQMVINLKT